MLNSDCIGFVFINFLLLQPMLRAEGPQKSIYRMYMHHVDHNYDREWTVEGGDPLRPWLWMGFIEAFP